LGHSNEVDVIRHQAVADQFHAMSLNALLEQFKVAPTFRVSFQNETPCIPALRDVVSNV
jgi:hypothetical protein